MRESRSNFKQIFVTVLVTLAAVCCFYLFTLWQNGELNMDRLNILVSAADNVSYVDENIIGTSVNQKFGVEFTYYYDKSTCAYGVKTKKLYNYFSDDMKNYDGHGIYMVNDDSNKLIIFLTYNERKDEYVLTDLYSYGSENDTFKVNKKINGVYLKTITYDKNQGWCANFEDGVKRAIKSTYEYPEYAITPHDCNLKLEAKFNEQTGSFEIKPNVSTINIAPSTSKGIAGKSIIAVALPQFATNVVARYDFDKKMWGITEVDKIQASSGTKTEVFDKNEVTYVKEFNLYMNLINVQGEEGVTTTCQFFDADGKYMDSCLDKEPSITEK